MSGSLCEISGETCHRGDDDRSQSLHSTDKKRFPKEANLTEGVESKAMLREGRQEGGNVKDGLKQTQAPRVPERAKRGAETHGPRLVVKEAAVWTERMLSALVTVSKEINGRSLVKSILRGSRSARHTCGLAYRETTPMWKPLTGEPYAGELHVRFGGRGGPKPSLPLSITAKIC
jgi:hypothetical protein